MKCDGFGWSVCHVNIPVRMRNKEGSCVQFQNKYSGEVRFFKVADDFGIGNSIETFLL